MLENLSFNPHRSPLSHAHTCAPFARVSPAPPRHLIGWPDVYRAHATRVRACVHVACGHSPVATCGHTRADALLHANPSPPPSPSPSSLSHLYAQCDCADSHFPTGAHRKRSSHDDAAPGRHLNHCYNGEHGYNPEHQRQQWYQHQPDGSAVPVEPGECFNVIACTVFPVSGSSMNCAFKSSVYLNYRFTTARKPNSLPKNMLNALSI